MPRAVAAAISTMSVPVAETAMSFSRGAAAIAAAETGVLLVITMSAPAIRPTTASAAVASKAVRRWENAGGRTVISDGREARSRKTISTGLPGAVAAISPGPR